MLNRLLVFLLLILSGVASAADLEVILNNSDPLATLPMEQLEQTLAQVKPLQNQATPGQKHKITLLKMRYLAIKGDYAGAMDLYYALELDSMEPKYQIRAYHLAIQITSITGDYLEAFGYLKKAQQLVVLVDSPDQKYKVLSSAAILLAQAGDLEKAMDMASQALHMAEQGKDKRDLGTAWNTLGDIQVANKLLDEAESSFNKHLTYARETKLVLFQGTALHSLGDIQFARSNYRLAMEQYQAARELLREVDYVEGISEIELGMADIFFIQDDIPSAVALLDPMIPKLEAAKHMPGLKRAYLLMSQISKAGGDTATALSWYEKYAFATEQEEKANKTIALAYQQVEFDSIYQEQRISLLEEKNKRMLIEGKSARQQKALYLLGSIASILISVLLGFWLVRSLREKREFQRLSQLDPLTGLYNHKQTYEMGTAAFVDCRRQQRPFAVAIADIDHFKQVNDSYGHATGDEVIKLLARQMRQHFIGDCIVGRTGGEEFSIFMPGKTIEQAAQLIEEFRQEQHLQNIFDKFISITMSYGLCMARPEHKSLDNVIRDADSALYEAKHSGRNHMVCFEEANGHRREITADREKVVYLEPK